MRKRPIIECNKFESGFDFYNESTPLECGFLVIPMCVCIFVILLFWIFLFDHNCIFPYKLIYVKCKFFQFNLAINDHPDVAAEVKKVTSGRLPSKESPMCVEISLKTNEVINNG